MSTSEMVMDAKDIASARNSIFGYINEKYRILSRDSHRVKPLELALQNQCLMTFATMLAVRSERLAQFSVVRLLWNLVAF